ncbi:MAG: aminotransferase class III-fold pyridoxal phosphate-dependent enzyme [Planctomycetota bacterium]|nr:aminotransferase class III-fold pyridoxal phosphate-dependent enzyme [Planctomycetota bacterium]
MSTKPGPAEAATTQGIASQPKSSRSLELFERAKKVMPGGVSRNTVLRSPYPPYVSFGRGCRVTDVDGVTRIDFSNNMASLIHGHAFPPIVEAAAAQLARGTAFMMATEAEVLHAEHMCSRSAGFDRIRFVNSGSEAVMAAVKAARAFTGRPMIAKAEGAYHGSYDYVETSQESTPQNWGSIDHPANVPLVHGAPRSSLDDVVVIPFNDIERSIALLNEHRSQLACVLLDLMPHRVGLEPADKAFVHAIAEWAQANGALFVADEVMTFRTEVGGLQARYEVNADLTAMGKAIGGGFPVGAVAGRAAVMEVMNPGAAKLLYPLSGTFSANPMTMTAGRVAMEHFDAAAVARVNALGERARAGIREAARRTGMCACVAGGGSMFRVHMKSRVPQNYRDAYASPEETRQLKVLLDHLFDEGFLLVGTAMLSTAMAEAEVDSLVAAMEAGFKRIVAAG